MASEVILITGASSGIGQTCASHLVSLGYVVYGTSRKAATGSEAKYIPLQMDVTDRQSVKQGIASIIEQQGQIDAVVNNAGMGYMSVLEYATEKEVRMQMDTNFMGVVNVCSEVLPHMRRRHRGKIINISSVGGVMGLPYQGIYSASKFAVEGYSEALALEVARFGIKICLIEPSDFKTGFTANRPRPEIPVDDELYKSSLQRTSAIIVKEEESGKEPIVLAKLLAKILKRNNPRFRYPVGKFDQVLSVYLKRLIPTKWFLVVLRTYYKV